MTSIDDIEQSVNPKPKDRQRKQPGGGITLNERKPSALAPVRQKRPHVNMADPTRHK